MSASEYARIKLTNENGEIPLKLGEYQFDRETDTIYVGSGDFPLSTKTDNAEGGD